MLFLEDLLRQERKRAKEQAKIEGKIEGMIEDILDVLEEYGDIPEALQSRIMSETDLPTLKKMFKSAVMAGSMMKFEEYLESL